LPDGWTKDKIREQAQAAVLGGMTKEEEAERSRRNKEMLPADKNLGHMTIEEKYDFARKYKDAGNVFFKEGRYAFATKNYTETITYIRHGLRMGETDGDGVPIGARSRGGLEPEAKAIIASCYSNMAACALKLDKFEDVVKHATNAIEQDLKEPRAKAKALFRRSKAHYSLGKVEDAYADISEAKKIDPRDKAVQSHYALVYKEYRDIKKQEHEAAKTLWQGKLSEPTQGEAEAATLAGPGSRSGMLNGGDGGDGAKGGQQQQQQQEEEGGREGAVALPPSFFASLWNNVFGRIFGSVWSVLFGRARG